MLNVIKESDKPTYSLFVPFTRLWSVDIFLQSLNRMYLLKSSTEIIFYDDTNDSELYEQLAVWLDIFGPDFNGAKIYKSGNSPPNDFDIADYRSRICAMKEKSKELISSDSTYTFCLEDDTIAPPNAFIRLLEHLSTNDDIAIASGVESGRHSFEIIGAWKISPLNNPTKVQTVKYKDWGTQKVDGIGWYCYITYTYLYKEANYRYEAECLGPDVMFALDQRRQGYDVLIDWTIQCKHLLKSGGYLIPNSLSQTAVWHKDDMGQWNPKVSVYRKVVVHNAGQ